jgi:8-oxo-dGTP pyrophosphatase MutT (NUDIX family)
MFDLRAAGDWLPHQVRVTWTPNSRKIVPEVERAIDDAWNAAAARLGDKLFDGPMCRLEKWSASPHLLELTLSRSSYRPFLGTNLHNARLSDTYGVEVLANPVGLSTALQTADGYLLLGRRNDAVAYYPNRVHPFAGALEPRDSMDVFEEIRRELREELHLTPGDVENIRCVGLVEDRSLRQPELIFIALTTRTKAELESQLDRAEHLAVYSVKAHRRDVERAMRDPLLTPVAVASLALWLERS